MRKNFDREKDLRAGGGITSAKAFQIINKNNLDKKFAPSNHSYM